MDTVAVRSAWLVPALAACGPVQAQTASYQVGERVELQANGDHWQRCTVIDPGSRDSVMRLQCDDYAAAGYSRGGGIYTELPTSTGVRPARAAGTAGGTTRGGRGGGVTAATAGGYRVGQAVEVEASNHWVPCTVESIDTVSTDPLIRVDCPAYLALSRAAGVYIVHNNHEGIRPATGRAPRRVSGCEIDGHRFRVAAQAECELWH